MVRVEFAALVDDMSFTLDIGNQEFWLSGKGRIDTVYGSIPVCRRFFCYMPLCDLVLALFQIGFELRVFGKINKAAFVGKGIDDARAAPLDFACQYVAGHGQWQLTSPLIKWLFPALTPR